MDGWSAAVAALATLAALILRSVQARRQSKQENADVANIQTERHALAKNDPTAVDAAAADQHDRVQRALRGG